MSWEVLILVSLKDRKEPFCILLKSKVFVEAVMLFRDVGYHYE